MKLSSVIAATCLALLVGGCATPQLERIEKQRALYESWPLEAREAVLKGQIKRGMTSEMVRMALGEPSRVFPLQAGGGEVWVYQTEDQGTLAIDPPEPPDDGIDAGFGRPPTRDGLGQSRAPDIAAGGATTGMNPAQLASVINNPGAQPFPRMRRVAFAGAVVDWADAP